MLETLMMALSLVVMGYAFYISSRLFWSSKSERGTWKIVYFLASVFIISTYALFAIVMFTFITNMFSPLYVTDTLNVILGAFLLIGAFIASAMMKYHLLTMGSMDVGHEEVKKANGKWKKANKEGKKAKEDDSAEISRLKREMAELRKELDDSKMLNRLAVDRELRIIELKKQIESKGSQRK